MPKTLKQLFCNKNQLTELPELSEGLEHLSCWNNNLNWLPKLPKSLDVIFCDGNNLDKLSELPDSLEHLSCYNNNLPYNNLDEYWKWYKEEHPDLWAAKQMGLY